MSNIDLSLKVLLITSCAEAGDRINEALAGEPVEIVHLTDQSQLEPFVGRQSADCLLLEIGQDGLQDVDAVARLHQIYPQLPIIAFADHWTVATAVAAIKHGASEVCELSAADGSLKNAILQATQRGTSATRQARELIPKSIVEKLSSVEARILHLLVQGRTTKEVGASLDVSIRTIHYRKKALLRKLGVQNRSEAIELIRLASGSSLLY